MPRYLFTIATLFFIHCMGATPTEPGGRVRSPAIYDSATIIRSSSYDILEEAEGESSTFFVLGLFPATNPISMDYALSQAVQKVPGGRSIVNIKVWHETHVMFPLGTVSVLKVKGKVIGNREEAERLKLEQAAKESPADPDTKNESGKTETSSVNKNSGGISVGGGKRSSSNAPSESGGISVGGKRKD
nr:hypothetical protein [Leptospira gomenensis]